MNDRPSTLDVPDILIVEDSPTQARRLQRILMQHGYAVRHASNGQAALEQIYQKRPTLVISDVVMPEMDGYELCARVKGDPEYADTPVILVTTLSDPSDVIKGLECRADNFILKPYDESYLISRVQFVLVNRVMRQAEQGGLAIEIYFNGQRHVITADRLQILNLLLSTYDAAIQRNKELSRAKDDLAQRGAALAERERQLDAANTFLEQLIAASPSIIFRLKPSGDNFSVTYVSPNIGSILGFSAPEVLDGAFWTDLIHPDDRDAARVALQTALNTVTAQIEHEYRCRTKDGRDRWFHLIMSVEYDAEAQPAAIVCHAIDITDKRRAAAEADQAREEAERANRAKSEFLSRMSHDLRTPLNAILGFAQLLELDAVGAEQRESVAHILRGATHLLELINEVLDIARIEAGHLVVAPEPIALAELLQRVVGLVGPLASPHGITIEFRPLGEDPPVHVLADRQRLTQVVLNLLSNAIKYNRPKGAVRLFYEVRSGSRVRVSVADTGPGIPADKIDIMFHSFERLGAEHKGIEGTGLGLSLARAITEAMGGTIGVRSTVGEGSVFWIELPQTDSHASAPATAAELQRHVSQNAPTGTVLHVEDNVSNRRLVERIMARLPGVKLVAAETGREGLELARRLDPDMILLDLHLGDMHGEEFLRALQGDPATSDIAVAVLSGDATQPQRDRVLASGAAAYLTKPIVISDLLLLIEDRLSGQGRVEGRRARE